MSCTAVRSNGKGCDCTSFTRREKDKKCGRCKHRRTDHTALASNTSPTSESSTSPSISLVDRIIAKYGSRVSDSGTAAASGSTTSTSAESTLIAAKNESNSGFRDNKPKIKIPAKANFDNDDSSFKVGSVVIIPCGLNEDRKLNDEICPKAFGLEELRRVGLSISTNDLKIQMSWTQSEIDTWLRSLFSPVFEWLDSRWGRPEAGTFHWVLIQKSYSRLVVLDRPAMTGKDLYKVRGGSGKNFMLYTIFIGLSHSISSSVYEDWETALANPMAFDTDTGDASDKETKVRSAKAARNLRPRRFTKKEKGKGRIQARSQQASADESVSQKSGSSDVEFIGEGSVTNPVSVNSDGEGLHSSTESAAPRRLRPRPRPIMKSSMKRRRSPSLDSETQSVSSKRSRQSAGSPNQAGNSSTSALHPVASAPAAPDTSSPSFTVMAVASSSTSIPTTTPVGASSSAGAGSLNSTAPTSAEPPAASSFSTAWTPTATAPIPSMIPQTSPRRGFSKAPPPRFDPWA